MKYSATGRDIINFKKLLKSIRFWILSFLENIGRLTYRTIFLILGIIFNSLIFLIQLIKLFRRYIKRFLATAKQQLLRIRFIILFIFLLSSGSFYFFIIRELPNPEKLLNHEPIISTKIYDRKGQLLFTIFNGSQKRSFVKLSDIPNHVKQATIAIEDKDFYKHPGFSSKAIIRAAWKNIFNNSLQGGSTITQQLVKNVFLTSERTFKRKIKEIILSIQMELIFSKDDILQMYLNEVPYGGTAYGIEEASQMYFNKSVKDLNLAEAALLAGLPAAPTRFSPFGVNPKLAEERQHQVLSRMVEDNYISEEEAEKAENEPLKFTSQTTDIKAPHFVMYVKDLLVEKYGQKMVEQGGLRVITSLDLDIQEFAQQTVASEVAKLKNMNVGNGAALVTKPPTGEILAMIGSKDYFDTENDGNVNVTIMPRQPGSAIKPVNYAVALSNGFTPATLIADTPITYHIAGSSPYSPVNYDQRFHGMVTLRTALGSSYNVPAVKTLSIFGVDKMVEMGKKMGITTWDDPSRYGLSLTLGGIEVKMVDMAVAYGTLANQGTRADLQPILEITDYKGKVLEKYQPSEQKKSNYVLNPGVSYLLNNILSDNQARTPAFGPNSLLSIPNQQVAVKTGTTNDKKDNWTIGYTSGLLTAVWVGNNDNSPMNAVASGITGASPVWNKIMSYLLENTPSHKFFIPNGIKTVQICSFNGLLPCDGCLVKNEYFLEGTEPKYHCDSEKMKTFTTQSKDNQQILEGIQTVN